jgi:tetratricopeptide (TPR) repeat protein
MNTIQHTIKLRAFGLCMLAVMAVAVCGCQSLDHVVKPRQTGAGSQGDGQARMSPEHAGKAPAVGGEERKSASAASSALAKAQALQLQGKTDDALNEFERAIENNPRLTLAYMGAGDIYRQRGDYDEAQKRYGKAADIEPRNFGANYMNGLMLQLLNRLSESVRAYLQALAVRPDDFNSNLNLATAYLQLGEPAEGLPYGQRAVQLNGKDAAARTNLGAIFAAMNRHEEAVVEYQQAAELAELSAPLLLNLAESLGKTQRYGEMVNTLEQLVKTEPTAVAFERLGFGQFRLRNYTEALAAFRKALEIDPNHYPALNGVGVCLLNQWKFSNETDGAAKAEAMQSLRRSVQLEPAQPRILELLGRYK